MGGGTKNRSREYLLQVMSAALEVGSSRQRVVCQVQSGQVPERSDSPYE